MAVAVQSEKTYAVWRSDGLRFRVRLLCLCLSLLTAASYTVSAGQSASDWETRIRALVGEGRLAQANDVVDEWLKSSADNTDARTWHARLQAWTNHWSQAEGEYRDLIGRSPRNVDLLAGLADVLVWQARYKDALVCLDQALVLDPGRGDCLLRRAQVLQRLGRTREARSAYQEILAKDASSLEAQRGLAQIRGEQGHELRIGADFDRFSYAESGKAFGAALRLRWNSHFSTLGSFTQYQRFGSKARRMAADATFRFSARDALTIGGAAAQDFGIIPRAEAQFEYGHGFQLSEGGPVRGVEALYQQRWLWYDNARLQVLSPGLVFYLPKDWNWLFRFSSSRIAYTGAGHDWKPSGFTRLSFPLGSRVGGHLLFATGTENYGYVDQIAQYSARTWGAGMRVRVSSGHEILGFGQYQRRSGGQNLTSFGVSYAIHF